MLNYTRRLCSMHLLRVFKVLKKINEISSLTYCRFLCFLTPFSGTFFYKNEVFSVLLITCWHIFPGGDFNRRIGMMVYWVCFWYQADNPGERIRGSIFTTTICPDLHTGHLHGLTPVSLSKRCRFVSGGCFCLISVWISGFSSRTNCRSRLRFVVWL